MRPKWVTAKAGFWTAALIAATLMSAAGVASAARAASPAGAASAADVASAAGNTKVALLDCGGLPCVTVQLAAGRSVKLLLDSGNAVSILDLRQAKALGLPLTPYRNRAGQLVPGVFLAQVSGARLGNAVLPPLRIAVMDLGQGGVPKCDGLLSYVTFKDRVVTIDYPHRVLEVSNPGARVAAPGDAGTLTYPTFGKKGPPIVATTGFDVNGQPITVQVDTLYSGTLLIYPTSVAKLQLQTEAASTRRRRFPFTDGGVDMIEGRALTESFGGKGLLSNAPLYFATPQVHVPDGMFDGTVGAQLFSGHAVTFDFHADRFWIV